MSRAEDAAELQRRLREAAARAAGFINGLIECMSTTYRRGDFDAVMNGLVAMHATARDFSAEVSRRVSASRGAVEV